MNALSTARLAEFVNALEEASRNTGVTLHAHGSPIYLNHGDEELPVRLNRNYNEADSFYRYVVEVAS